MKPRAHSALVLPICLIAMSSLVARGSQDADASPTPSLMTKTLEVLHIKRAPKGKDEGEIHNGIELKLGVDPLPFQLSNTRQVKVTLTVVNHTKKYVHYDFPTSQRIEVLVKDGTGKVVNTWSEDQSFTNDPAAVTVNPGERLEYTASVATREMTAGEPYVIEAFFPSYPAIKAQLQVTPSK